MSFALQDTCDTIFIFFNCEVFLEILALVCQLKINFVLNTGFEPWHLNYYFSSNLKTPQI